MHSLGLRKDGRLLQADGFIAPGVLDWTDLTAVAVGPYHTVAVKQDGTVVASGDIQHGQCQMEAWTTSAPSPPESGILLRCVPTAGFWRSEMTAQGSVT